MRKLSAKWVPKCLNAYQKRQRYQSSEQLLEFFRRDPNDFLSRLVTTDETWLYRYDPETKQQSMEWRHSGSLRPASQEIPSAKIRRKISRLEFLGSRRHSLHYLPKGQTIQREYYSSLLVQLKDILMGKKNRDKVTKMSLVLTQQSPGSPGTCKPEDNGLTGLPMSRSTTLFSGSDPVGLSSVPWTEKKD